MNNYLLQLKVKERLNKLASFDYDNIECWQFVEAFNKAQLDWARRQVYKGETTKETLDNLQPLLKEISIKGTHKTKYFETTTLPKDYLAFKKVIINGESEECNNISFKTYLVEEQDIEHLLADPLSKPSYKWGETLVTLIGNKVRVYTNEEFKVSNARLSYYRNPINIQIAGCANVNGYNSTKEVECEFKDSIAELLIDETVAILASDIESWNQATRSIQNTQRQN